MGLLALIVIIVYVVYLITRRPGFETGLYVLVALLALVYLIERWELPAVFFQRLR